MIKNFWKGGRKITIMHWKNRICPKCKSVMVGYPAISRKDNKTLICSNCGILESIEIFIKRYGKEDFRYGASRNQRNI